MKNFIEKYGIWFPLAVLAAFDIITACLYPVVSQTIAPMVYVQICGSLCAVAAVTLVSRLTPVKIPTYLIAQAALSAALANNLGTVFDFYHLIPSWDLILHGYFGCWCAQAVWLLLKSENVVVKYLVTFVCVMGVAALWEVFEFTTDLMFGGDAQRVQESLELGINPIVDTMTDIIIAAAGYAAFCAGKAIAYFVRRPSASLNGETE
ncbi:MAG: hypothetical protein ACI4L9_04660 [Candidatus Coproplasma sp.]